MLPWHIALLVSVAIAISYLDRQTLLLAIGEIPQEIPISNSVKAVLDSSLRNARVGATAPAVRRTRRSVLQKQSDRERAALRAGPGQTGADENR
jgi:hypothetical protein